MPPPERQKLTAWFAKRGHVTEALQAPNHALYETTLACQSTPEPTLRDRTMTAAHDLNAAVQERELLPPMGVATVGAPFQGALVKLRHGTELLTSLPLSLDEAAAQVMDAVPVLKAGYDGIGKTTQAVLRFGPA